MGDSLISQTLRDTYRIEGLLAEGGGGVVYEASHLRLGRRLAIKVLSATETARPESATRFQQDWSELSTLEHRHIVEPVDFFLLADKRPALVMEMLPGATLAQRLKEGGRYEVSEAAAILRQVTNALQAAHKKKVVHRDLRPQKILLCREKDVVKIVGFGMSRPVASQPLEYLPYLAPEQVEQVEQNGGKVPDYRVDAYGVAAMMFEMLTGRPPFMDSSVPALLGKIKSEEPALVRTVRQDIPEAVEYVLAKSLRKDPQRRYPSMGALSREFSSTLGQ